MYEAVEAASCSLKFPTKDIDRVISSGNAQASFSISIKIVPLSKPRGICIACLAILIISFVVTQTT